MNGTCVHGGQDDYGHGTHVAGTIGATANNSTGIAGINWRTQILACKFLDASGNGNMSDAILCFNQVLSLKQQAFNIRVTSNSWGGSGFSQALKDAMASVEAAGILNICAAGNNADNSDLSPAYPAAYDNRGIVSVLASDQNDLGASFTNYGLASVDIAAPGVSVLSTVPTVTCPLCDPSGYRVASGTSMATPHVAGVAVAMFHLNPGLTPYQARDVLLDAASYDAVADSIGSMTSTGGRLNFQKVIANPLLFSPSLNSFPTITGVSNVFPNAGAPVTLSAALADPDHDTLRTVWTAPSLSSYGLFGWMAAKLFPAPAGSLITFQAPSLARTAVIPYEVSVADGRGGSALATANVTTLPKGTPGAPPSGALSVSPTSGPVGTTVSVNFPVSDPEGGPVGWDLWLTGAAGNGNCCNTGSSTSLQLNAAGAYRITVQAIDQELNFSDRQTAVVRIGGATGTPPIARASLDKLTGAAPLTVNIDMSGSIDPDGTIQSYTTICEWGKNGLAFSGVKTTCTYDIPGTYWIILQVIDNSGLLDVFPTYVVVTPPGSGSSKQAASVTLSNLTQTYTGSSLAPVATTNPPGLAITWTNAPQTAAGSYAISATVNDPNYQGSASATFSINKMPASVTLTNLTQTYTGSGLTPAATTNPPGLAIAWTNATQTRAGSYTVTAAVNNPNYSGSATGTFTINKAPASVVLSNLTQTYTGAPLAPSATTNPAGLSLVWTNAPDINAGSYAVTATVNDPNYQGAAGGTFTINPAPGSVPPSAAITAPGSGTVPVKNAVNIQASVVPGTNPIARVDFLVNGSVACSDAAAPYTCSWNVPAAVGKSYQFQVKAYDTAGQVGASGFVNLTSSR
jgi:hypothetical protein